MEVDKDEVEVSRIQPAYSSKRGATHHQKKGRGALFRKLGQQDETNLIFF
jgi:hypothetical protein